MTPDVIQDLDLVIGDQEVPFDTDLLDIHVQDTEDLPFIVLHHLVIIPIQDPFKDLPKGVTFIMIDIIQLIIFAVIVDIMIVTEDMKMKGKEITIGDVVRVMVGGEITLTDLKTGLMVDMKVLIEEDIKMIIEV